MPSPTPALKLSTGTRTIDTWRAELGTADPVVFRDAAPDASWSIYCQARSEESSPAAPESTGRFASLELDAFLNVRGREQAIEDVAAIDPRGRHLVYSQAGRFWLLDAKSDRVVDLSARGADGANDRLAFEDHRSFSFDDSGSLLSYSFWDEKRLGVRLFHLKTGQEKQVASLPGTIWRQRLSPSGDYLVADAIVEDTNNNGRLDWPVPPAKRPRSVCQLPVDAYPVWAEQGDRVQIHTLHVRGSTWQRQPGFVAPFGAHLLVKDEAGQLLMLRQDGRVTLATAKCNAKVLHADPERSLVLIACPGDAVPAIKSPVFLVGPGSTQHLDIQVGPTGPHSWPNGSPRLVALYPGSDVVLIDLETRRKVSLRSGDQVLATSGALAVVRRSKKLFVLDVESEEETTVAAVNGLLEFEVALPWIWVRPWLFNLHDVSQPHRIDERVLALSSDGRALVARSEATHERLAMGPLTWLEPPSGSD